MGLGPCCRRRQSRDLGDSGQTADRQGGSSRTRGSGQQQQNPARLVRIRTRSTIEVDYGAGSLAVLQNGAVDGDRTLKELLKDTQPVARWQGRLKRLLTIYIMPQDAFQALAFLEKNMDTAIVAVEDPSQSRGYPALCIDVMHKPQVFDLDHWKDIMIALHFEITEPESNRDLGYVEVKVSKHVTLGSLLGFKFLLRCLSNVSWGMLQMLLAFTNNEALRLLAMMQNPSDQPPSQANLSTLHNLYARYPDQLSALGFTKHDWHPQSPDSVHHFEVALIGLFHSGLETYI